MFSNLTRRIAAGNAELRFTREPVADFLPDAFGEIGIAGRKVPERYNGDRSRGSVRPRRSPPAETGAGRDESDECGSCGGRPLRPCEFAPGRGSLAGSRKQRVTDARHGFDGERLGRELFGQIAQRENAAIKRIVADDAAVPALIDQAVPRHDGGACRGEGDEHLRNFRLELPVFAVHRNLAAGWTDAQVSQIEI